MQLLSYSTNKQKRVTRSTFAAETGAVADGTSQALLINGLLTEVQWGPHRPSQLLHYTQCGGHALPLVIVTDSRSLFDAVTATEIKTPSEPHLMFNLLTIREWLDSGAVREIVWLDTRAMLCDGLTKGVISRVPLMKFFQSGEWLVNHPFERWSPNRHSNRP